MLTVLVPQPSTSFSPAVVFSPYSVSASCGFLLRTESVTAAGSLESQPDLARPMLSVLVPQPSTSFRLASAFSPYSVSASCDFLLLRTECVTAAGSLESQPDSARPMMSMLIPQQHTSFRPASAFSPYSGSASCDFLLLRNECVTAAGSLES